MLIVDVEVCESEKKVLENCNFWVNYGRWAGCGWWVCYGIFHPLQICRHSEQTRVLSSICQC